MEKELIEKIEQCHSAVDLYEMKDEILEALGGKKKAVVKTVKKELDGGDE
jgi:hypothetical protein